MLTNLACALLVPTLGALRCVVADQSFNHNTISVQYYKWRDYRSAHGAVDWEEAQGVRVELEMQEAALPPPSASGDTSGSGLNPVGPFRPTGEAAREAFVRDFLENRYALAGTIPALADLHRLLGDSGLDIRFVVTQFFEWRRTRGFTEPTPLLTST